MSIISWIAALTVHDMITFMLASALTFVSIIFVLMGAYKRYIEAEIEREKLKILKKKQDYEDSEDTL